MSRVRLMLIVLGMAFALPAVSRAAAAPWSASVLRQPARYTGTWQSTREELPVATAFEESVWGKHAKKVRAVRMTVRPGGEAILTVTREVVDARGRVIRGSRSIEYVELTMGEAEAGSDLRQAIPATVQKAERRYPDDPSGTWQLDGLQVLLTAFRDDARALEVRIEYPQGEGSFWETLRRTAPRDLTLSSAS